MIQIWDSIGTGIIIKYPSGVMVSNQTGGTSCLHPTIEGIFLPLRNDYDIPEYRFLSPELKLAEYFEGPKWEGTGATEGIDTEDANFIDEVLVNAQLNHCITVDRGKLGESHEAWIHIIISKNEGNNFSSLFSGFEPYPRFGVFTWANSD